jgi:hypothetical protein
MMIDRLTQEQQWGWAYQLQQHNAGFVAENVRITEANALLEEGATPQPLVPLWTMDQYVLLHMGQIGDVGYKEVIRIKEKLALDMFRALPPEQQAALVEQFQVPDVIQE